MILFGEGHVHFHVVSSLLSDELFLKGIDEGVGTDGQRVILALAAFKRFAVRKAFIIDHSHIAVFYRSVHRNHSGVVLSLLVQVCVNLFVGNRHVGLRHFHTLIGAKRNFRLQSHFCRKDEGLSGLNLRHVDLRGGYDGLLTFLKRLLVSVRDQRVRCILIEKAFSIHLLDHSAGHLALTETGNLDFSLVFLICLLNRGLKFLCGNLNRKNRHVLFLLFHL